MTAPVEPAAEALAALAAQPVHPAQPAEAAAPAAAPAAADVPVEVLNPPQAARNNDEPGTFNSAFSLAWRWILIISYFPSLHLKPLCPHRPLISLGF